MSSDRDAHTDFVIDENYVNRQKMRLLENYVRLCGFRNLDDPNYVPYGTIQNSETQASAIKFLPALRTVYQTQEVRSITNKRQDKRLALNLLRQLLKTMGYGLDAKTYHLINNGRITSSSKYRIIKLPLTISSIALQESPQSPEAAQDHLEQSKDLEDASEHTRSLDLDVQESTD